MDKPKRNYTLYFFCILVVLQLFLISYFYQKIKLKQNTLGVSINYISSQRLKQLRPQNSNLIYFYEPAAHSIEYPPTEVSWYQKDMGIQINSDTLNEGEVDMSPSRINIVTLGDSFTYGQFVKREDNWVTKTEKMLNKQISPKIQTINLGVKGYDIEYAVERYRIRGQKYNPQLVIWLLKGDDFGSIAEILTPLIQEEEDKISHLSNPDDKYVSKKGNGGPPYINKAIEKMTELLQKKGTNLLEYQRARIKKLRDYYKGNILIAYLDTQTEYEALLKELAKEDKKLTLVKLPDIYIDTANYFPDLHPTEKGYTLYANEISKKIIDNKLISK